MVCVTDKEELGHMGFNAGKARKRAARMLAAKWDLPDVSDLLKAILDEKIAKALPEEMRLIEAEDPKARSRQQAIKKAA